VDAAADDAPALRDRRQRRRDQSADRREDDRGVQRLRRRLARAARPFRVQRQREFLGGEVAVAGEGEDPSALPAAELRDNMRRRAEAVYADSFRERQPISPAQSSGAAATGSSDSASGKA
jgi:hypothetical protein